MDSAGNAYVTGLTTSTDFPVSNAIQPTHGGGNRDGFITRLNAAGNTLDWSTYLGGSSDDSGKSIALDSAGNAYVTGSTMSDNFPTMNAFQADLNGGDAFVTKLGVSGSLAWSTYLGGDMNDIGHDIVVDKSGNVYVTGETASTDFPTRDPFQGTWGGGFTGVQDVFISVFDTSGSDLIWSTYLGRSYPDIGRGIALGMDGNIYVTGETGLDFPADNIAPVKVNAFVSRFTSVAATSLKAMPWLQLLLDE